VETENLKKAGNATRKNGMERRRIHLRDKPDHSNSPAERAARAELERQLERPLTDQEWADQRKRLLQFVQLMRRWDMEQRSGKSIEPRLKAAS
jgi:hypothetical protein